MKLLIAEDDSTSRMMLMAVAKKWGYDVTAVADGQAAWEVMQEKDAPRLILIDWEMPRMNGIEFCEKTRALDDRDPPYIILLTARSETVDVIKGLDRGANDYIAKPFDNAELQVRMKVGQGILKLQDELHRANDILYEERSIIEDIILGMRANASFNGMHLRSLEQPVEKTSGDVLFAAICPDGTQHIMLGDFTGHGITAALGGPAASDTFYKMTSKGLPMANIAAEINTHMCEKMPVSLFLAAILFDVNPERTEVKIWNCGMEHILFFRGGVFKEEIKSNNLALGILDRPIEQTAIVSLEENDRFYAYSDGITETINSEGEMFGQDRLVKTITRMLSNNEGIVTLEDVSKKFRGDGEQLDDLTVVELTC